MRRELPAPKEILEELIDKAALQIDRLAPVAFDAALEELTRYHRFLLNVNATRSPDGKPFNYAAVPGEALRAPHNEWINQYRRLFERAASHIGDDADFIEKLAHVPLRLLPGRDDPEMSDQVLQAILDLGLILIHQIEAWVTRRTVADTGPGTAASPRMSLAGSDAKSYASLLPQIVGAWERLIQMTPSVYRWCSNRQRQDEDRWNSLRTSWPFLWQHLRNTAYMLAVSVWNEDESGAASFRDALVRWPQTLSPHLMDRPYLPERRLLFPDILLLDLGAAKERIKSMAPEYMSAPSPDELFNTALYGAHDDVLLLTAALLLQWSMDQKQLGDIGARTASTLLRRQLEDTDDEHGRPTPETSFGSIVMDVIRFEIAGAHGADLDHMIAGLDNMTERRVVPGRVFTPSTLHGRGGLQPALLAVLLARAPMSEDTLVQHILDVAKTEPALSSGDRSLRDIVRGTERLLRMLETPPPNLRRGVTLLKPDADFSGASACVKSILSSIVQTIETERKDRLRKKPIDSEAIEKIRDATERALMSTPGGVPFFKGFSVKKRFKRFGDEAATFRFDGLNKAQFVDPPMESGTVGFTDHYAQVVTQDAGRRVWNLFKGRRRETVAVPSRIDDPAFWESMKFFASDVGAEPLLIVSRRAQRRARRKFIREHQRGQVPLSIERKPDFDTGNLYLATIEGIDVHGADFEVGKAWLFSPYLLQSLLYAVMDEDEHILRLSFQPDENLQGPLVAEYKQRAVWAEWPIYEIDFEDLDHLNM